VQPQPGDLAWAQGQVPTPHGPISVSWSRDARTGTFTMDVRAPRGTSGTVAVPVSGAASVLVDGAPAWTGSPAAAGARAGTGGVSSQGGYVYLHGVTGSHVIMTRG
jgi:hypothetical protein